MKNSMNRWKITIKSNWCPHRLDYPEGTYCDICEEGKVKHSIGENAVCEESICLFREGLKSNNQD